MSSLGAQIKDLGAAFFLTQTVIATICNQALSHDRCIIFPGLSYNKANDTFLNSLRNNDVEAEVEFTLKVIERARVTCY